MAVDSPSQISVEDATPADAPAGVQQGLGRAVGHGFSWLSLSFIAGKALSFVAQIALGALLSKADFGVFAIASSVATFAKVFNDGGLVQLLVQRGSDQFRFLAGPGFWIGICFSAAAGAVLAAAAPLAAHLYGDPKLTSMLWVIALSLPLGAPALVTRAKLRIDLRFRALTIISVGSVAIRHLGAIFLAFQGFGALSFVLPLLGVAIFEDVAMFIATREKLWNESPNVRAWPGLLRSSIWVVVTMFFSGFLLFGDYLVLGLYLDKSVVGQYFFGYQLTTQIAALMWVNLQYVLLPVLSRLASEPVRQAAAFMRTVRVLMILMSAMSLVLVVIIEPLEFLIWKQKWAAVVPLMQIFAIAAPLRSLSTVLHAVVMSRGQFRLVAMLTLLEGMTLVASAWLAVRLYGSNLTGLAAVIGSTQVLFAMVMGGILVRVWGIGVRAYLRALLPNWALATACAGVTLLISSLVVYE
jgi:O-antigen/teichoic acid export membrane protein